MVQRRMRRLRLAVLCNAPLARLLLAVGVLAPLLLKPGATEALDVQDDILGQTSSIRGLEPKAAVPFAFVDASSIRKDLLDSYTNDQAVRDLEISRKLLVLLGLLSPDADLHGMLVDL